MHVLCEIIKRGRGGEGWSKRGERERERREREMDVLINHA